jgi:hypothetical protein
MLHNLKLFTNAQSVSYMLANIKLCYFKWNTLYIMEFLDVKLNFLYVFITNIYALGQYFVRYTIFLKKIDVFSIA